MLIHYVIGECWQLCGCEPVLRVEGHGTPQFIDIADSVTEDPEALNQFRGVKRS